MPYTIIKPKDHDEWLAERRKGIGSSDAGTIMGVSPFSTPLRLWRQRMGLDEPVKETASMRNGHYLEPAVAEFFAHETGSVIDYSSEGDWIAADNDRPYLRVSPDRLFWPEGAQHDPKNWLILEIKSTSKLVDPDNLPLYWVCQVQYQMGVMGIPMAAIAWITSEPRLSMNYAWVRFNPNFFKTLTDAIDHFWNNNLQKGIMPDPVDEDDMSLRWPHSEDGKLIPATADDISNCREYNALLKDKEELESRISMLASAIKGRIGDGEALIAPDEETGKSVTIARFKSINETVFDEERFHQEKPEEYLKYVSTYFDKATFKDEDKANWKAYTTTKKGARRFSVLLK